MMQRIVPVKQDAADAKYKKKLMYLEDGINQLPAVAVPNAHLELCRMGRIANENLALAIESFFEKDLDKVTKVLENEKTVDYLNHKIASKLVSINNMTLSDTEAKRIGQMFIILSDIERIGDHAVNIAEYTQTVDAHQLAFSETALKEVRKLADLTINLANKALVTYERQDMNQLSKIKSMENKIDKLSKEYTENHINRLKDMQCEPESGVLFTDMIIDLERSADHANNIAFSMSLEKKWNKK
jgi:phosphate:Na+ symporter